MNQSTSDSQISVPLLDLAPRRRHPLSLWNPLDYFHLLYWCFFFPQALRWYLGQFGQPEKGDRTGAKEVWEALKSDPVQRKLLWQAVLTLAGVAILTTLALQAADLSANWRVAVVSVTAGLAGGVVLGMTFGVAVGVASGIVVGVTLGAALSLVGMAVGYAGGMDVVGVAARLAVGVAAGLAVGVAAGLAVGVAFSVAGGVSLSVGYGLAFCLAGGVLIGVSLGAVIGVAVAIGFGVIGVTFGPTGVAARTVFGLAGGVALGIALGIGLGIAGSLANSRLPDWLWSFLLGKFPEGKFSRIVWIPLPGLQRQLEAWLENSWSAGVHNINQILRYSSQFIPALAAVNAVLGRAPKERLLMQVAKLTESPFDWDLLRFGSASLGNRLLENWADGLIWLPEKWKQALKSGYPSNARLDTPAQAACAGFWYWQRQESGKAVQAFETLGDLPYSSEVQSIAEAISAGEEAANLEDVAEWKTRAGLQRLEALPDEPLRPGTLDAIHILRSVSEEAETALRSTTILNRASALARGSASLNRLAEDLPKQAPYPEWPLLKIIAEKWQGILIKVGGEAGEQAVREPIPNPFAGYSGLPVSAEELVGRRDILRQIEKRWATSGSAQAIILFGHRRMGKTSILRNLEHLASARTSLVYLDMQDAGWIRHTGELLLDLAEALHRKACESGWPVGDPPAEEQYSDLGKARRSLNALLECLDSRMAGDWRLILAVDEFELIEAGIEKGRIDSGLPGYLRALNQKHSWLALIFAGLHTMEEMGRDYKAAFYGQAEHIRVSYLSREDTLRLVTQPNPDFSLDYTPELLQRIYRLTYGQPYLTQRLCWELVHRWNERFLKRGEATPRILRLEDLAPVLDADFYAGTSYYFDGVWSNVTGDERRLMKVMSRCLESWTPTELEAKYGAPYAEPLKLLLRHDVVVEERSKFRFAAELMRRYIGRQAYGSADHN